MRIVYLNDSRKNNKNLQLLKSWSVVRRAKALSFNGCEARPVTFASAGSNRSSRGGNKTAEASGSARGICRASETRTRFRSSWKYLPAENQKSDRGPEDRVQKAFRRRAPWVAYA
jgi:hypothetical protein